MILHGRWEKERRLSVVDDFSPTLLAGR